ncbi:hypothetical protein DL98DRAFT_547184 [Cadophora sp. DSE1049]|nr:hypothetical protein DL98DRAFT_547184 [Cadophora sp. DSE1049]
MKSHVVQIATIARSEAPGGHSSYYGRTSALYDDDPIDRRGPKPLGQASDMTRRQLMGEAAHQRQLETINYKSGKLDFDGVNPELGMHLLTLHWNRQHHSHLITYRPAFMRDMAGGGPYFSKLLLNAIYFGSCKFSPREEVKELHVQFRQRVRELLGVALDKSDITTIQAMLVMTNSLFALGDERSAAWIYAGIAFRMLIDLGTHLDNQNPKITEEDLEIRRRVFWGAFVVDKIQSLYQGRPVSIQEVDVRTPILFQDQYEELEHWQPFAYSETQRYPGSPAYSVSTFTELCKLSVIMNSILNIVYGVKSTKMAPELLAGDLERMHDELESWKTGLPEHLAFDPSIPEQAVPPPHVLSLHSMYNVLLILLHRPFVSEGHLHSTSRSIPADSFVVCAQAATRIVHLLRVYERTFSIRHAPYLIAYATYVSATIHVRIAAQLGPGSDSYSCLRTCLSVFVKNQETNWAARRAQSVIVNLMKKMRIELDASEERTPASILVACIAFFLLPNWPTNTKWLSPQESEMAQYRVLLSNGGKDEGVGGTWDGVKAAAMDPFTWMFCGMHFSLINAQSFKDFFPSILKTFGFDKTTTYLVQAPPYAIAYITACLFAYSSGRFGESCYHIIGPVVASAVGCAVLISTVNVPARYIGAILLVSGTYNGLNLQLSWETNLVPSPRSKKAALIAIANW